MTGRVGLLAVVLSLGATSVAGAAEPIACPAKVGTLELANPNSTFPGTKGDLRGDVATRATYVCSYGERINNQPYITGQTYILMVSWVGPNATDLTLAVGCGVTRSGNTVLEVASASKRAWADFNIAIEPHTAALRAATQGLLAQAEALAMGCGALPSGPSTTTAPTTTTTPSAPAAPATPTRRQVRWNFVGVHAEDGFYVVTRGHGRASADRATGALTREGHARGKITLSFYRGTPKVKNDYLGLNSAPRKLTGRIWLSVHGPGNFAETHASEEDGYRYSQLELVIEVDDVRGTPRMRRLCRAEPFGLVGIEAGSTPSDIGYVMIERVCGLAPFRAVGDSSGSDVRKWLPLTSLQIA